MEKINFIDISNVDCWMIYLMPFESSERSDYNTVLDLQESCKKEKIFGMGWDLPCFNYGTPMTDKNAKLYSKRYKDAHKKSGSTVSENAIEGYKSVKKGDYVITRLKNGHYCVGRVSSDGAMYLYKENDPVYGLFSWGGEVEKWVEYSNDQEIPAEIAGRFSQRLHSTIQRVARYRQRLLIIAMYEKGADSHCFNIPKLRIGLNNFARSLTYMELEDIMALYISQKHEKEGYRLLPSSCKISQQNYEFSFVNGRRTISCQVKNQSDIEIDNYVNEASYERIYFFSGTWNEDTVRAKREQYKDFKHIYIVSPEELYVVLKEEHFLSNDFYDYENEPISPSQLNLEGYTERKKPNGEDTYSIDDDFICFVRSDGLFYSAEFGSLVLSWDIFNKSDYDKECIKRILRDINR